MTRRDKYNHVKRYIYIYIYNTDFFKFRDTHTLSERKRKRRRRKKEHTHTYTWRSQTFIINMYRLVELRWRNTQLKERTMTTRRDYNRKEFINRWEPTDEKKLKSLETIRIVTTSIPGSFTEGSSTPFLSDIQPSTRDHTPKEQKVGNLNDPWTLKS